MLQRRSEMDPLARARLSHGIRLGTSDDNWLVVNSANLDELAQRPLPGVTQQLWNLVRWLAGQLGEEYFGRARAGRPETLASIVGAVDRAGVVGLINYAIKQNLIEWDTVGSLGLTPEGWQMARAETHEGSTQAASSDILTAHKGSGNLYIGELTMGDSYRVGQAGAVGPSSRAHDMTFQQIHKEALPNIDFERLSDELATLRGALRAEAITAEQDFAVAEVGRAEKAAQDNDGPTALAHLKNAGSWTLSVAEKIGVGVATAALKSALGF